MKRTIILASISVLCLLQTGWGQVPRTISYQGVLKDDAGNLINDSVNLVFSLYDAATEGTELWSETYLSFTVNNGVFNVILGSSAPLNLDFDAQYWLQIEVDGGPLSPRTRLTSSPYSLSAQNAVYADTSDYALAAPPGGGAGWVDDGTVVRLETSTDSVGIGTTVPAYKLDVSGDAGITGDIYLTGQDLVFTGVPGSYTSSDSWFRRNPSFGFLEIKPNSASYGLYLRALSGNDYANFETQSGYLTIGYNTGDGPLYISSTNVGIGTNSPGQMLTVVDTIESLAGYKFPDGSVQTSAATGGGTGWSLAGNSITTSDFLGSTNNIALDFRVNNARVLRLEPTAEGPNVIGGYSGNTITSGVYGATIGGGGLNGYVNQVTANYGTVGGGQDNTASGSDATVGGGNSNTASNTATVGGGRSNTASGGWTTIGGGNSNTADGTNATVGGGVLNTASGYATNIGGGENNNASGWYATVPGGSYNTASGQYSFAAGRQAKAVHDGAFVWADGTDADFASTAANEFAVRATGGFRFLTSVDGSGLRLEPNATSPNVIGGYSGNTVTSGVVGATIGGGGADLNTNRVIDNYCTVAGGQNNQAGDNPGVTDDFPYATVGGGEGNTASSAWSTVGGGQINTASGASSTIGGGWSNTASGGASTVGGGHDNNASGGNATVGGGQVNTASGSSAFVGGGYNNIASGSNATVGGGGGNTANNWATVPGGYNNSASGIFGFAAGRRAKANHTATFVWADYSVEADFASTADNQFLIRAAGGVGIDTTAPAEKLHVKGNVLADAYLTPSSLRWKENITLIEDALDKVQRLRGVSFDWKADGKHDIGLIAEEVGEVIPEVVAYEENGVDARSVDYARLVALLIEGMKEQQREIEALQAAVAALRLSSGQAPSTSSGQALEAQIKVAVRE